MFVDFKLLLPIPNKQIKSDIDKRSSTGIREADPSEYGKDKNDKVTVYTLPKSRKGGLCSFSYKLPTSKAKKLKSSINQLEGKLISVQNDPTLSEKEKANQINNLKCRLKYLGNKFNSEMAATPTNHVIVEAN